MIYRRGIMCPLSCSWFFFFFLLPPSQSHRDLGVSFLFYLFVHLREHVDPHSAAGVLLTSGNMQGEINGLTFKGTYGQIGKPSL